MLKKIPKACICLLCMMLAYAVFFPALPFATATNPSNETFRVNVKEFLSVSITTPTTWASGNIDTLLRNKVTVSVTSNNATGFVVGLNSGNATATLSNTSKSGTTLPTLSADWTRSSNATNFWGYSINDDSSSGTYKQVPTSSAAPAQLFNSTQGKSKDIYFGAKADITQASGTYAGTVVITAISGATTINTTPSNPATPAAPEETAQYNAAPTGGTNGATTYTYTTTNTSAGTTTTTTQVSDGDNTSAYSNYTPPQGVTENTVANVANNSTMAIALAATASVAAVSGAGFFIAAKRKKDNDEDESSEM